jgi:hypothetical protein
VDILDNTDWEIQVFQHNLRWKMLFVFQTFFTEQGSTCLCLWLATVSPQSRAHICVSGLGSITSRVPHTNTLARRLLAHSLLPFRSQTRCLHLQLASSWFQSPVSRFLGASTLTV